MKNNHETEVDNGKKKTKKYIILFILGLILGHLTYPFVEQIIKTFIH